MGTHDHNQHLGATISPPCYYPSDLSTDEGSDSSRSRSPSVHRERFFGPAPLTKTFTHATS